MPHMYILNCSDNTYYVGSTWNLERRLFEHNKGKGANYTKKRLPIELVYTEWFNRIDEAYYRERQIHNWTHKKKEALISENYQKLKIFSKKDFKKKN